MGLDLLDTPVRLTWDVPGAGDGEANNALLKIADAILDGGVFFVTLQGQPLLHPQIGDVLAVLAGACQLLVCSSGTDEELACLDLLPSSGCQLLLDAGAFLAEDSGIDDARLQSVLTMFRQAGFEPALSLTPLRSNLANIPELLRFCARNQVAKFKLPNAHIGDSFQRYSPEELPRWQDLELFSQLWTSFTHEQFPLPKMEIHDLFLWEIMTPGQEQARGEYGGCQAGNSLGHVDSNGVVHPCAAWPQPLGQLPGESLEDIWAGKQRAEVRKLIAAMPQGCLDCDDLNVCFGGCRGLSHHLNRHHVLRPTS